MKIIAIDYGLKRVGLALSVMGIIMPHSTIINISNKHVINKIETIIKEEDVTKIIIGMPFSSFGENNETSIEINKFINLLKENIIDIPIFIQDEHSSTKDVISSFKNQGYKGSKIKKIKDMGSACVILSKYIEKNEFN